MRKQGQDPVAQVGELTADFAAARGAHPVWPAQLIAAHPARRAHLATDLFTQHNPLLTALFEAFARERHTDRRIAASQVWKAYCYWLAVPAIVGWAVQRRVVDLSAANVLVTINDTKPYVTFSLAESKIWAAADDPLVADARIVDESALLPQLIKSLVDEHLFPALVAFRERSGLGNRILWGSVAVAFTHPFGALSTMKGRAYSEEITAVRTALGPAGRLIEMVEVHRENTNGGTVEPQPLRKTCCQKMRIPGENNCANCPLLSARRRTEISAAQGMTWLLGHPTALTH